MRSKILKLACGVFMLVCFACSAISCSCDDEKNNNGNGDDGPAKTYAFEISVNNGLFGTCTTVSGRNTFEEGVNVEYVVNPSYGKCILKIVCDDQTKTALDLMREGQDISGRVVLNFNRLNSNHRIHVDFGNTIAVDSVVSTYIGNSDGSRALMSSGGRVPLLGNNLLVPVGTAVGFKIQPSADYKLKEVSLDGETFYSVANLTEGVEGLTYEPDANIIIINDMTFMSELHVVFKPVDVIISIYEQTQFGTAKSRVTSQEMGGLIYAEDLFSTYSYCYYATRKTNFEYFLMSIGAEGVEEKDEDRYVKALRSFAIEDSGEYEIILLFSNNANLGN